MLVGDGGDQQVGELDAVRDAGRIGEPPLGPLGQPPGVVVG